MTFEGPLAATSLSYIVHRGDEKDISSDRSLQSLAMRRSGSSAAPMLLPTVGPPPSLGSSSPSGSTPESVVWKVKATDATESAAGVRPPGDITIEEGALSHEGHGGARRRP
ncbi:hypothetical protein [Streptomyces shaanxiensis]